jgi:hypothetical protein
MFMPVPPFSCYAETGTHQVEGKPSQYQGYREDTQSPYHVVVSSLRFAARASYDALSASNDASCAACADICACFAAASHDAATALAVAIHASLPDLCTCNTASVPARAVRIAARAASHAFTSATFADATTAFHCASIDLLLSIIHLARDFGV